MSIELNFCATLKANGEILNIEDTTGAYSTTNIGGYGTPNDTSASAQTAVVQIWKRNEDGAYGDMTEVDVYPTLPSDSGGDIDIDADDAGQSETMSDGVYKIKYKIASAIAPYTYDTTQYKSFHPAIDCCYQNLALKQVNCSCNCADVNDKLTKMTLQFALLKRAECSGDLDAIQKYINYITRLCDSCGCGCS
jgi:hypothetical protein